MSEAEVPESIQLVSAPSGLRYALHGKPLHGGDTVALCFSGGWLIGRFDWNATSGEPPHFSCSIELENGRVAPFSIEIPDGALMLRRHTGVCLIQSQGREHQHDANMAERGGGSTFGAA